MKKIFSLLAVIIFSGLLGSTVSAFAGTDPALTALSIGGLVVLSSKFVALDTYAYSSTDLSAISNYAHQFQKSLITTLVNGMDIASDIMVMPNVKSSMKLPKIKVGDGFRPFSCTTEFQTGDAVYTDRELKVAAGKRELLICPEDYRHTYFSLMLSPGSYAGKFEIPFAKYLWDEVIKSVSREVNDEVAWFGFDISDAVAFSAAATYDPGDYVTYTQGGVLHYFLNLTTTLAGEDPDDTPAKWQNVTARAVAIGLKQIIEAEITGGGIVPITTGVIDNTTGKEAFTAFIKLFREMPVAYKRQGAIIHASFTDYELLLDDLRTNFQYTVTDISNSMKNGMLTLPMTGGNGYVKPATWLGDSRRLIAEPVNVAMGKGMNLHMGTDLLSDFNKISTKENLWSLEAGIRAVLGFQIADLDAIWVGNQA